MSSKRDRRRFLKESTALAGLALGAVRSLSGQAPATSEFDARGYRPYGERSRFEKALRARCRPRATTIWDFINRAKGRLSTPARCTL